MFILGCVLLSASVLLAVFLLYQRRALQQNISVLLDEMAAGHTNESFAKKAAPLGSLAQHLTKVNHQLVTLQTLIKSCLGCAETISYSVVAFTGISTDTTSAVGILSNNIANVAHEAEESNTCNNELALGVE